MEIAAGAAKKKSPNRSQYRVAKVTVQKWHCIALNASLETIPYHQIAARAELFEKTRNPAEVVTIIGVTHDDVATMRRGNAARNAEMLEDLLRARYPEAIASAPAPPPRAEQLTLGVENADRRLQPTQGED